MKVRSKMVETSSGDDYYQFEFEPGHVQKGKRGQKVFVCDICRGVFKRPFSLKRHYLRFHINYAYLSPRDLNNCAIVAGNHRTASAKKGAGNTKQLFRCHQCGYLVETKNDLLIHLETHPEPDKYVNGTNRCPRCSTAFSLRKTLKRHIKKNRCRGSTVPAVKDEIIQPDSEKSNEVPLLSEDSVEDTEEVDMEASLKLGCSTSLFRFACTLCSKMFTSYVNMCRHRRLAHGRYGICSPNLLTSRKSKYIPMSKLSPIKNCCNPIICWSEYNQNARDNLDHYIDGKRIHINIVSNQEKEADEISRAATTPVDNSDQRWSWGSTSYSLDDLLRLDIPVQMAFYRGLQQWQPEMDTNQTADDGHFLTSLGLTYSPPTVSELPVLLGAQLELSGEWTRPKSYICAPCGAVWQDFLSLLEHQHSEHSNVWCYHIALDDAMEEVMGELQRQVTRISSHVADSINNTVKCTKCSYAASTIPEFHAHILQCSNHVTSVPMRKKRRILSHSRNVRWQPVPGARRGMQRCFVNSPNIVSKAVKSASPKEVPKEVNATNSLLRRSTRRVLNFNEPTPETSLSNKRILRKRTAITEESKRMRSDNKRQLGAVNSNKTTKMERCDGCQKNFQSMSSVNKHKHYCPAKQSEPIIIVCDMAADYTDMPKLQRVTEITADDTVGNDPPLPVLTPAKLVHNRKDPAKNYLMKPEPMRHKNGVQCNGQIQRKGRSVTTSHGKNHTTAATKPDLKAIISDTNGTSCSKQEISNQAKVNHATVVPLRRSSCKVQDSRKLSNSTKSQPSTDHQNGTIPSVVVLVPPSRKKVISSSRMSTSLKSSSPSNSLSPCDTTPKKSLISKKAVVNKINDTIEKVAMIVEETDSDLSTSSRPVRSSRRTSLTTMMDISIDSVEGSFLEALSPEQRIKIAEQKCPFCSKHYVYKSNFKKHLLEGCDTIDVEEAPSEVSRTTQSSKKKPEKRHVESTNQKQGIKKLRTSAQKKCKTLRNCIEKEMSESNKTLVHHPPSCQKEYSAEDEEEVKSEFVVQLKLSDKPDTGDKRTIVNKNNIRKRSLETVIEIEIIEDMYKHSVLEEPPFKQGGVDASNIETGVNMNDSVADLQCRLSSELIPQNEEDFDSRKCISDKENKNLEGKMSLEEENLDLKESISQDKIDIDSADLTVPFGEKVDALGSDLSTERNLDPVKSVPDVEENAVSEKLVLSVEEESNKTQACLCAVGNVDTHESLLTTKELFGERLSLTDKGSFNCSESVLPDTKTLDQHHLGANNLDLANSVLAVSKTTELVELMQPPDDATDPLKLQSLGGQNTDTDTLIHPEERIRLPSEDKKNDLLLIPTTETVSDSLESVLVCEEEPEELIPRASIADTSVKECKLKDNVALGDAEMAVGGVERPTTQSLTTESTVSSNHCSVKERQLRTFGTTHELVPITAVECSNLSKSDELLSSDSLGGKLETAQTASLLGD